MTRSKKANFKDFSCRASAFCLAFFFLTGLFAGTAFCVRTGPSFAWMRGIPQGTVSIVSVVLTLLFPFLLTFVSRFWDPVLIFPVCFCRAFLFSYIHCGFSISLGPGDWLLRWMLLPADILCLPLLYLYWRRCIRSACG